MPFKAGDKVVVVKGKSVGFLQEDKEYTVKEYTKSVYPARGGGVRLEGLATRYYADRFQLVAQPLVFVVGAQVERIAPSTMHTVKGGKYTIKTVYRDPLGAITRFTLDGVVGIYSVNNFKVVANAAAFDVAKWEPQEGEQVHIIAKDRYWTGGMDFLLEDKAVHTIRDVTVRTGDYKHYYVRLENGYVFDAHVALRPVNATKATPKVPPAPPAPLDLREALYERQKQRGLGNDLASFGFETKGGIYHLYPYVCHAKLCNDHGEIIKMAYCFRNDTARVQKGREEEHKAYAKYIISESPWASAFITQDIEEAIAKDIYMNVEVNRYMMAGACVALRTGQEYGDRPVIFKTLLDLGHNPHTCWLMSCAFTILNNGLYNFNSWTGGHDVIDRYRTFDDVIKFFQEGYFLEEGRSQYNGQLNNLLTKNPYRTHHGAYAIACTIAGKDDKNEAGWIGTWFQKHTKKSTIGEGWDKKTVIDVKALDDVATQLDKIIEGKA